MLMDLADSVSNHSRGKKKSFWKKNKLYKLYMHVIGFPWYLFPDMLLAIPN